MAQTYLLKDMDLQQEHATLVSRFCQKQLRGLIHKEDMINCSVGGRYIHNTCKGNMQDINGKVLSLLKMN